MRAVTVNSPPFPGSAEGPEEGEIVSEDELEDISDCSMTFTPNGKSFSHYHHLKALSLSSVTENEMDDLPEVLEKPRKRRKSHSQRPKRRKKIRLIRKSAPKSDSSDDETSIDERLKLQLKAAVHVEVEEAHRNSLRTRLRAMVKDLEPENELNSLVESKESVTLIDLVDQDTSSVIEVVPTGESDINLSGVENNSADSENYSIVGNTKNEELDNELMQLRLEALKTAINNKFSRGRKRRKDTNENKENTGNNNSGDAKEVVKLPETSPQLSIDSENNTPPSPDEDEDVLRALLLASMSKKIMKSEPEKGDNTPSTTQTKQAIIRQNKLFLNKINHFRLNNKVKRVLANTKKVFHNVQMPTKVINMPQVKPLIITLNSESDSDWDISSSPEKPIKKIVESKKAETVREKPSETEKEAKEIAEPEVSKEMVPLKPNEEIISCVEKFLKEQRAKVELELSKATTPVMNKNATRPLDLEKSALKYLSESKREEYRKLQNLLKMKMKKSRVRRISHKLNDSKNLHITVSQKSDEPKNNMPNKPTSAKQVCKPNENANLKITVNNHTQNPTTTTSTFNSKTVMISPNTTEKITLQVNKIHPNSALNTKTSKLTQTEDTNVQLTREVEERLHAFKLQELRAFERDEERRSGSALMKAKLRELQSKTNGRLQIQDKYKPLRPLVKKLIDLNKQQKQCDQEVGRLMQELEKAREKQDVLHKTLSSTIVILIEEKKKIDLSHTKTKELTISTTLVTSTPIKPVTGNQLTIPSPFTPSASVELKMDNSRVTNLWEQTTVCNNKVSDLDDATLCKKDSTDELTVVDPNDIDNIIQETEARVAVLEKKRSFEDRRLEKVRYVSPLDSARRKSAVGDPFKIICPFEVNGTCKDPDCTYNHFLK